MPALMKGALELRVSTFQRPVADDIDASIPGLKQMVLTMLQAPYQWGRPDCRTISEPAAALAIHNAHQTID